MEQIFIFIIVALFWAARAWWTSQQEKMATQELERRERDERGARPPTTPTASAAPTYAPDQRYVDIQEEIRRRIAERQGLPPPAPRAAPPPAPRPAAQPPQPYKPSPSALPPIRPVLTPELNRARPPVKPARPAPPPVARPAPVPAPAAPVLESAEAKAYAMAGMREAEAYPDEAAAYALAGEPKVRASALHLLLASPNAARKAFLMREIFDKPLCLRDTPGGQQSWN